MKNKTPGHFYVNLKTPILHGSNSEFDAKDINLKMSWGLIWSLFFSELWLDIEDLICEEPEFARDQSLLNEIGRLFRSSACDETTFQIDSNTPDEPVWFRNQSLSKYWTQNWKILFLHVKALDKIS